MKHEQIPAQPVIEAERFTLRPLRKSDAGLLSLYAGDERVARSTRSIPHPIPPGLTENYVTRAMSDGRSEDVWALDATTQGQAELIGVVSLDRMENDQSEIGYWVAPQFWNTGIASEAVAAILSANPHNARTIFAEVFQDNPGSARVLTNAGFQYLGDAEAFSVARNAKVATWTYIKKLD